MILNTCFSDLGFAYKRVVNHRNLINCSILSLIFNTSFTFSFGHWWISIFLTPPFVGYEHDYYTLVPIFVLHQLAMRQQKWIMTSTDDGEKFFKSPKI